MGRSWVGRAAAICVGACVLAGLIAAAAAASQPGHQRARPAGRAAHGTRHARVDRHVTAAAAPAPAAQRAQNFVVQSSGLPMAGEATASGCAAALAYLDAYAAPGFTDSCPGDAGGHQALTTCESIASPCDVERVIAIADPCPAAYMNEASNSWVLLGESDAPIDPYGSCP